MSNEVTSNIRILDKKSIFDQRVNSIDKNRVNLPFNVKKSQIEKLMNLLEKVEIEFVNKIDRLEISKFVYGNIDLKSLKEFADNKFTLAKSYVVTMKQDYISKVREFYQRIIEEKHEERPIFDIGEETNLQQALKEATAEIDLSQLNAAVKEMPIEENKTNVVLANSTLEENEIKVDNSIMKDAQKEVPVMAQPIEPMQSTPVVNQTPEQPISNQQPIITQPQQNPEGEIIEQPKVKIRKLRGNVLVIPIIIVWLGLILFGSIKLVTSILT